MKLDSLEGIVSSASKTSRLLPIGDDNLMSAVIMPGQMRFRVTGASPETGDEVSYLAEASSPENARYLADLLGMLVFCIEHLDVEPPRQDVADERRSRRKQNRAGIAALRRQNQFPGIWRSDSHA